MHCLQLKKDNKLYIYLQYRKLLRIYLDVAVQLCWKALLLHMSVLVGRCVDGNVREQITWTLLYL